jgi:hypothetical protein
MVVVDIYVEGQADQRFLADLLKTWYGYNLDRESKIREDVQQVDIKVQVSNGDSAFTEPKGWNNIKNSLKTSVEAGSKVLIILDADGKKKDDTTEEKSEKVRIRREIVKNTISNDITGFDFETQLYLWPNNQVPGTLEDLLETIINPDNQPILECWSSFEQCISSIPEKSLTLPANKTKIYAYLETLLGSTDSEKKKIKESNRDYTNTAHWNLDPTHKNLQPLKTFLDQHLLAK